MVLNNLLTSTVPQEYNSCLFCSTIMQEQTPLSLNQLIRDGVDTYRLSNKKRAEFELNLCDELKKTGGEPNQLRRVFTQMVDCLVGAADVNLPWVLFNTRNLIVSDQQEDNANRYRNLASGAYVSLRIEIGSADASPETSAQLTPRMFGKAQVSFNPFVWSQISEVIQVHGGTIIWMDHGYSQSVMTTTSFEIVLPALES